MVLAAVGAIGVVTVGFATTRDWIPHTVPALVFLVPITWVALRVGRTAAVGIAVLAAFTYALAFLPPIGGIRIGLTEDVVTLVAFVLVALVMSVLGGRQRTRAAAALDEGGNLLLRTVSHDLRNPLSTIRSVSTDLLDRDRSDDPDRKELLHLLVDESDRLDRIVGNLLSATRVSAGALSPSLRRTSVAGLVVEATQRLDGRTGASIATSVPDGLPDVLADATQIDQVLTNLIENAIRHASTEAGVSIAVDITDTEVVISVSDDGPGLTPEARARLFEPFNAGPESSSTGLGLAVCRAIVDAHGGTIGLRDDAGGGTTARFTLRRADHADPAGRGPSGTAGGPLVGAPGPGVRRPRG